MRRLRTSFWGHPKNCTSSRRTRSLRSLNNFWSDFWTSFHLGNLYCTYVLNHETGVRIHERLTVRLSFDHVWFRRHMQTRATGGSAVSSVFKKWYHVRMDMYFCFWVDMWVTARHCLNRLARMHACFVYSRGKLEVCVAQFVSSLPLAAAQGFAKAFAESDTRWPPRRSSETFARKHLDEELQ